MTKTILFALMMVAYFVGAHIALVSEGGEQWAALIAILPLAAWWLKVVFADGVNGFRRGIVFFLGLCIALPCWRFWARWVGYADWAYLLQSMGSMILMASIFGSSLLMKEGDWVTRMATIIEGGSLPPEIARYTRSLTIAWTIFFLLMACTSVILFVFGPRAWWSAFINILTWPLVGAAFALEFGVRKWLHPTFKHADFLTMIKRVAQSFNTPAKKDGAL